MLEERQQAALLAQQRAQQDAQREFEEQQRRLAEQQQRDQEALLAQQAQWQTQGRLAELERENLNARAQYENDQLMLQQYDHRVKALEGELAQIQNSFGQQITSKDDQIRALQEQVNTWRTKYESLAKLYSQLRHEHLDLLQKFKSVQLKAASAQEAIDKREKLEREIKTKNLELADMIRERDRALHDKDRLNGSNKDEVERLKRELRMAQDKADNLERSKGNELSTMLAKYNREMSDLEEALRNKSRALDDAHSKLRDGSSDLEQLLREKEEELEVYKAGMDQTLIELNDLKQNQGETDHALDGQIDALILSNLDKINDIIDSVLQAGVSRVDDALYELDSSMQAGNQNASPSYVLSQIEKASASAMEFATSFNNFIADGPNSTHADVIKAINVFAGAIADVCSNTKGLTRLATDDKKTDSLMNGARLSAQSTVQFFRGLQSFRLEGMDPLQKTDVVINSNNDVQMNLQKVNKLAESFAPGFGKLANNKGDLGDLVDSELSKAADAIAAAAARLAKLKNKPRDGYSTYEVKVHDSILDAATAITNAIAELIKAATLTQQEIVQAGRGSSSRTAFYKKNNRWTEGLISAAKAVASSTNTLIETADGVLSNRNSPEQLIVASNDVAASTAQLVAASRVKAGFMSKSQDRLEQASKAVGAACRALVRQVQSMIKERSQDEEQVDYAKLGAHEFKVREMEQQVSKSLYSHPWFVWFALHSGRRASRIGVLELGPAFQGRPATRCLAVFLPPRALAFNAVKNRVAGRRACNAPGGCQARDHRRLRYWRAVARSWRSYLDVCRFTRGGRVVAHGWPSRSSPRTTFSCGVPCTIGVAGMRTHIVSPAIMGLCFLEQHSFMHGSASANQSGRTQVEILQLENALASARHRLGEMRKISYQEE